MINCNIPRILKECEDEYVKLSRHVTTGIFNSFQAACTFHTTSYAGELFQVTPLHFLPQISHLCMFSRDMFASLQSQFKLGTA